MRPGAKLAAFAVVLAAAFGIGAADYRVIFDDTPAAGLAMSHVSTNYDRSGFQRDINIAYPIDRLNELAADGVIGSVAATHYAVMGSTDPKTMGETVDALSVRLAADKVDAVLFLPV